MRPQSLIGERFVECQPTQKRAVGTPLPPPLKKIDRGPGKGQFLLPVSNTSKAVDLDLINDIMRRPYAERFSLIVNELGTGLAGRGTELRQVLRRANPALREVDQVLKLLASQNRVLADLARDSDTRSRRWPASASTSPPSSSSRARSRRSHRERRGGGRGRHQASPGFARLRPTMVRLGALSDEMTPVLSDLGDVAPDINRLLLQLGPFSQARSRQSLGGRRDRSDARDPQTLAGRPAVVREGRASRQRATAPAVLEGPSRRPAVGA